MSVELTIPKLGMTMKEATITNWVKSDGDWVEAGEVVLVIETEKITYEVESPTSGYLQILVPQGKTCPVGTKVGLLLEDRAAYEALAGKAEAETVEAVEAAPADLKREAVIASREGSVSVPSTEEKRRVKASPLARKIAKEHGIDIGSIAGTGPGGRIVRDDVLRALEEREAAPRAAAPEARPPVEAPEPGIRAIIPLEGMRKRIFAHMHQSLQETAQMTLTSEVDASELVRLRNSLLRRYEREELRISYNDILVRILSQALREHPELNSSVDGDRIVQWEGIHIGVAMELEDGLIVPVVREADKLTIAQIHRTLQELFRKAREKKLLLDDIKGGTFTLTNLGHLGIDAFTPILNRPESGILGVGRLLKRPVVVPGGEDRLEIRPCLTLSLTVDHRIIDGAPAARFLRRICEFIQDPFLLVD